MQQNPQDIIRMVRLDGESLARMEVIEVPDVYIMRQYADSMLFSGMRELNRVIHEGEDGELKVKAINAATNISKHIADREKFDYEKERDRSNELEIDDESLIRTTDG